MSRTKIAPQSNPYCDDSHGPRGQHDVYGACIPADRETPDRSVSKSSGETAWSPKRKAAHKFARSLFDGQAGDTRQQTGSDVDPEDAQAFSAEFADELKAAKVPQRYQERARHHAAAIRQMVRDGARGEAEQLAREAAAELSEGLSSAATWQAPSEVNVDRMNADVDAILQR